MRIWDVDPKCLCRKHLLAEHRELHGLWNILIYHKVGYSRHPETLRWVGKEAALYTRHEKLAKELLRRGYKHLSPLSRKLLRGSKVQNQFLLSRRGQIQLLKSKPCDCPI